MCIDLGPGLWVEQNSGNTQQTNTAEFDYRTSNNGFTVVYNGNQLATVVIPSDTPATTGVLWPQLLPPFNTACGCCDLCRAQPNTQVRRLHRIRGLPDQHHCGHAQCWEQYSQAC